MDGDISRYLNLNASLSQVACLNSPDVVSCDHCFCSLSMLPGQHFIRQQSFTVTLLSQDTAIVQWDPLSSSYISLFARVSGVRTRLRKGVNSKITSHLNTSLSCVSVGHSFKMEHPHFFSLTNSVGPCNRLLFVFGVGIRIVDDDCICRLQIQAPPSCSDAEQEDEGLCVWPIELLDGFLPAGDSC